ncbi:aureocin A53 family class IId bacteriocin [Actinoplanes sp. NEAU-A12]|uniref:Aureocin A53 family class IId bacteriocin n=1 Tax=Actinoplanes sandaracinus TaxID=3045177 RepID=A0ABT6WW01_9ACTN|nr:aureocin A53 family class IId bacteriocin [Actinoplanes sandaracinus]MDI6103890.1 aureocin A53 family class IId bacteriocin [Actinoplanes sandaracinus]
MAWLSLAAKLIKMGAKYGSRFANWVWNNKSRIMNWVGAGWTVVEIFNYIVRILGY